MPKAATPGEEAERRGGEELDAGRLERRTRCDCPDSLVRYLRLEQPALVGDVMYRRLVIWSLVV